MKLKHYILFFVLFCIKIDCCYGQTNEELLVDLTKMNMRQALERCNGPIRLKVKGHMNGDDVFYLRKYAIRFLKSLDLKESGIKKGGMSYITTGLTKHYTQDNTIGAFMFSDFRYLEKVILPDHIEKIDKRAFDFCEQLNNINIPSDVEIIEEGAFAFTSLEEVVFPNKLKKIGKNAFYATKISSVYIPTSLIELENSFWGCDSLTTINVDSNHNYYSSLNGALCNKDCSILYIYPPKSKCSNLTLPESLFEINSRAFCGCKNLFTINLPENIKDIGVAAFEDCTNLQTFTIPNSVKEIKTRTFKGCKNLKTLYVPKGFNHFGSESFKDCINLEAIYCFDTHSAPGMDYDAFPSDLGGPTWNEHYNTKIKLYIPYGTRDVYYLRGIGYFFLNIIEMESATSNDYINKEHPIKMTNHNGYLILDTNEKIRIKIYDIKGELLINKDITGFETISLTNDLYIISTKYGNNKILIK